MIYSSGFIHLLKHYLFSLEDHCGLLKLAAVTHRKRHTHPLTILKPECSNSARSLVVSFIMMIYYSLSTNSTLLITEKNFFLFQIFLNINKNKQKKGIVLSAAIPLISFL